MAHRVISRQYSISVAIGGIADIVQHWHEMARSRMTQSGHERLKIAASKLTPEPHFAGRKSLM